jgi:Flp pilus assembly protein TadG
VIRVRLRALLGENRDEGSAAISAVIVAPVLIVFLCLVMAAGRIVLSSQVVDDAAEDAAREASSATTPAQAQSRAYQAAVDDFSHEGLHCTPQVTISTGRFPQKAGQSGSVTAAVTCRISLSDLVGVGIGTKTMRSTWTSYVDTYEQRG